MKALTRLVPVAVTALAAVAFTAPAAFAATTTPAAPGGHGAVFALTDAAAGNAVVAYRRAADGTLTPAGTYPTGGLGGILTGSVVDHTASEGAVAYDQARGLLLAVNPGSDSVSVFRVSGDQLALRQVLPSGGDFPVSVAVHGDDAYVLNALGGGSLAGYRVDGGRRAAAPLVPRARPRHHPRLGLHRDPGAGRVHPGRPAVAGDHQGDRERRRRVRRRRPRPPFGHADRQPAAG